MSTRDNLIQQVLGRMHTAIGTPEAATDAERQHLSKIRLHLAGLIVDDVLNGLHNPTYPVLCALENGYCDVTGNKGLMMDQLQHMFRGTIKAIQDGK